MAPQGPLALAFHHRVTTAQLATDVVFLADVVLNFAKPNVQDGDYVTSSYRVACHYLTGGFLLDAVAALPWDRYKRRKIGCKAVMAMLFTRACVFVAEERGRGVQEAVTPYYPGCV